MFKKTTGLYKTEVMYTAVKRHTQKSINEAHIDLSNHLHNKQERYRGGLR